MSVLKDLQVHAVVRVPEKEQDQDADVADECDSNVAHQGSFLAFLLGSSDSEGEEGDGENVAQDHHGHVEAVVVAHHAGVEHDQDGDVGGDGEGELAGAARDHETLQGLVGADDLEVLGDLDFLLLVAADAEVFGLVFLPDADDGEDGQEDGDGDADGGDRREPAAVVVAEDAVPGKDGADELHDAHAGEGTDGVEDREERALLRIVGEDRLGGSCDGGLEGVADDPDRVEEDEETVAQSHHARGDERCEDIERDHGERHDDAADDHEGTELAEAAVGLVHQGADDRVGDGVEDAHAGDHEGGEDRRDPQHRVAEGGDIGEDQYVIDIGGAVVHGEQGQLVRLGAVELRAGVCLCVFVHGKLPFLSKRRMEHCDSIRRVLCSTGDVSIFQ